MGNHKYLWVVEMYSASNDEWKPCEESAWFTKNLARVDIDDWREQNPNKKYRITKYVQEVKNGKS